MIGLPASPNLAKWRNSRLGETVPASPECGLTIEPIPPDSGWKVLIREALLAADVEPPARDDSRMSIARASTRQQVQSVYVQRTPI